LVYTEDMKKNISIHITSFLTGAGAVLAVIHPGFKVPTVVESLVASISILATTAMQTFHYVKKSNTEQNLALATHLVNQIASSAKEDVAPAAPATPTA